MLNPLRIPNVTCDTCTGPIAPQYTRCYRCAAAARAASVPVARRIVPLTYAIAGGQADSDMYRDKDPMADDQRLRSPSYQRVLLLSSGIRRCHASCRIYACLNVGHGSLAPRTHGRASARHCRRASPSTVGSDRSQSDLRHPRRATARNSAGSLCPARPCRRGWSAHRRSGRYLGLGWTCPVRRGDASARGRRRGDHRGHRPPHPARLPALTDGSITAADSCRP